MGFVALLGVCGLAIFSLNPLGYDVLVAAAVSAVLAWLLFRIRRQARPTASPTRCQAWFRKTVGLGRGVVIALLASWLGLIGWARLSPAGTPPPPKTNPEAIRVVTWNIHCGQESGPFWKRFDWAGRKTPLRIAIDQAAPDILCVQEAVAEQVAFLEQALPSHQRVGVGRDDGDKGGEYCAIYCRRDRFEMLGSGTFWLEEPTDRAVATSPFNPRRICTWARLRDLQSGRLVRVYNTHLYLTEGARQTAARVILAQIAAGDPTDAVILTGDFNTTPGAPTWNLFTAAGLTDSAKLAGQRTGAPTYHFYGIPLRCIDGVLVRGPWQVRAHRVLDVKPENVFPSDHFGILTDLVLRD